MNLRDISWGLLHQSHEVKFGLEVVGWRRRDNRIKRSSEYRTNEPWRQICHRSWKEGEGRVGFGALFSAWATGWMVETLGKMKRPDKKIWEVQGEQGAEKGCRRPEDQELMTWFREPLVLSFLFNIFFHFYNLLFLNCSWFTVFWVYSKVIQIYRYMYTFFRFCFIMGYYKILNIVPWAIQ